MLTSSTFLAGNLDDIKFLQLAREMASQRKEAVALRGNSISCELELERCNIDSGGSSAERGTATGPRSEPAGSSKSAASGSAGPRDGSAATAGAESSSVKGIPGKAQPMTSVQEACRTPSQLIVEGRRGDPAPHTGAAAATASMSEAPAEAWAVQSLCTEVAAQTPTRQDNSAAHRDGALQPGLNETDQLAAGVEEGLAQNKSARAGGWNTGANEAREQSGPELAAQEAKQTRKQAKRARQRARKAQGTAADADSKVCSCLWLCVTTPCLEDLRG